MCTSRLGSSDEVVMLEDGGRGWKEGESTLRRLETRDELVIFQVTREESATLEETSKPLPPLLTVLYCVLN